MKRARNNSDSDPFCHKHRAPASEPTIKSVALQNGWSDAHTLATLSKGLPKDSHQAFDLQFADLLGVTMSKTASESAKVKIKKPTDSNMSMSCECVAANDEGEVVAGLAGSTLLESARIFISSVLGLQKRRDIIEAIEPAFRERSGKRAAKSGDGVHKVPAFVTKAKLTAYDRKVTLDFLQDVGKGVFIAFCDLGHAYGSTSMPGAVEGENRRLWYAQPRLPFDNRPKTARVLLSAPLLLNPCLQWRDLTATTMRKRWFELATVLLHELAHVAVGHAFQRSLNRTARAGNIYFRREVAAEAGWSYTSYAFGGYLEFDYANSSDLSLAVWPCPAIARIYDAVRGNLPRKGAMPPYKVSGNVPLRDLDRFFEASFWEKRIKPKLPGDRTALQFERCCGTYSFNEYGLPAFPDDDHQPLRYAKRRRLA